MVQNFVNSVLSFIESSIKNIKNNVKNNKSTFYYFSFFFILVMYFIFFNANSILPDNSAIINTPLNSEVDVGSTKLFVTRCEYDKNKNFMEIELNYSDSSDSLESKLNFSAKSKVNVTKELNVKTMITTDDTYIIHVEDIPKNYEAIALKVSQNSISNIDDVSTTTNDFSSSNSTNSTNGQDDNNEISNDTATIYFDYRKVKINNNLKVETQKSYLVEITKTEINAMEKNINTIATNIRYNTNLINMANTEINNLEGQYKYEIEQDQNNTTQEINNYKSEINDSEQQNDGLQNTKSSLEQEIQQLEEKASDIAKE